jgi:hypothetical protein
VADGLERDHHEPWTYSSADKDGLTEKKVGRSWCGGWITRAFCHNREQESTPEQLSTKATDSLLRYITLPISRHSLRLVSPSPSELAHVALIERRNHSAMQIKRPQEWERRWRHGRSMRHRITSLRWWRGLTMLSSRRGLLDIHKRRVKSCTSIPIAKYKRTATLSPFYTLALRSSFSDRSVDSASVHPGSPIRQAGHRACSLSFPLVDCSFILARSVFTRSSSTPSFLRTPDMSPTQYLREYVRSSPWPERSSVQVKLKDDLEITVGLGYS